jgi:hypothetical protein
MPTHGKPKMNDTQYLWDGTGPVDIEVAALERTLAPLRYKPEPRRRKPSWGLLGGGVGAIAAMIALLVLTSTKGADSSWKLALEDGTEQRLRVGQHVTTKEDEVHIRSVQTGYLQLEPHSELRVLDNGKGVERVALEYGSVRAVIWAPPARFGVELPAATAVDLGCIYRLQTNREGDGVLSVEAGWVALQNSRVESFIPAGASAHIDHVRGPGLPVFDDADDAFKSAVRSMEAEPTGRDLDTLLALARPRDGVTLWHLLQRTDGLERERVARQFADLVGLPEDLSVTALVSGRPESLDAAWDALGLGTTEWWRTWKQQWQPAPNGL